MTVRTGLKAALALLGAVVVICTAAFAWMKLAPRRVPVGQPPLAMMDASSLPVFRDVFNTAEGEVRVLAMLSPT